VRPEINLDPLKLVYDDEQAPAKTPPAPAAHLWTAAPAPVFVRQDPPPRKGPFWTLNRRALAVVVCAGAYSGLVGHFVGLPGFLFCVGAVVGAGLAFISFSGRQ
jgi:hypothetical protein